MSRGPDAGTLVARMLEAESARAGCPIRVASSRWTRWSSATFDGARHELTLAAPASPALDAWLKGLGSADLPIRGHLLADIVVEAITRSDDIATIEIGALTVES